MDKSSACHFQNPNTWRFATVFVRSELRLSTVANVYIYVYIIYVSFPSFFQMFSARVIGVTLQTCCTPLHGRFDLFAARVDKGWQYGINSLQKDWPELWKCHDNLYTVHIKHHFRGQCWVRTFYKWGDEQVDRKLTIQNLSFAHKHFFLQWNALSFRSCLMAICFHSSCNKSHILWIYILWPWLLPCHLWTWPLGLRNCWRQIPRQIPHPHPSTGSFRWNPQEEKNKQKTLEQG